MIKSKEKKRFRYFEKDVIVNFGLFDFVFWQFDFIFFSFVCARFAVCEEKVKKRRKKSLNYASPRVSVKSVFCFFRFSLFLLFLILLKTSQKRGKKVKIEKFLTNPCEAVLHRVHTKTLPNYIYNQANNDRLRWLL